MANTKKFLDTHMFLDMLLHNFVTLMLAPEVIKDTEPYNGD